MQLSFVPTLDRAESSRRLGELLVPGSVLDATLSRRIARLAGAFECYSQSYPLPMWAPGLALDNEMRGFTEAVFPLSQVRALFELTLRRGCRFAPFFSDTYLHSCATWPDLLQRMAPHMKGADPSRTLYELARDPEARVRFIFALFLPQHFGGGFDRYPKQALWLGERLSRNAARHGGRIRVLDSACGSGEGTYRAAELLRETGYCGEGCVVHGSTLEPIELFAASHAFFPHDSERERSYRARIASYLADPDEFSFGFYLDRVDTVPEREPYDLVLCNGLLGGPLLHDPAGLAAAFTGLAARVAPGGLLVAADRFHAGWRLRIPHEELLGLMKKNGLEPLQTPEGIAGRKPL